MSRIRLSLDALAVETFAPAAAPAAPADALFKTEACSAIDLCPTRICPTRLC